MNINENKFYHYVPVATNPEGSGIFEMVQDDLRVANASVATMLGDVLYKKVVADQDDELSALERLCKAVERYICLYAFDRAIPSLDLVLTATGFGVVSNANVAPASAERVARLIRQVRDMKECAFDDLLDNLRGNEDWCESEQAKRYFSSIIWSGAQLKYLGYPNEYRTKLAELSPRIAEAERSLILFISPEFHAEITAANRTATATGAVNIALDMCRAYICSFVGGNKSDVDAAKGALIQYLDSCLEHFPTYAASSAYRANHFDNYENNKEDSCYFFG